MVLYNFIGCTKDGAPSDSPPSDSLIIKPSIYSADDSITGLFIYSGIAYDSVPVIDSVLPVTASGYPSGYHTSVKIYEHQVAGQIRINRLISDPSILHLSRPINDGFDSVTRNSGIIFQTDANSFVNFFSGTNPGLTDTIIKANLLGNVLTIPSFANGPVDIRWYFIKLLNGDGKFVNGKWEINFQTSGNYTERIASLPAPANPMPFHQYFLGYHNYRLTCVKQH